MGRLTLRKFHLRLAEWRLGQRYIENRVYLLYSAWVEKPPPPWEVLQFLNQMGTNGSGRADAMCPDPLSLDDSVLYMQESHLANA